MQQLEIECRITVMAAVKAGDVTTAVKMLERIDRKLAQPKQLHELAGDGGGPIENHHVHLYIPDNGRNPMVPRILPISPRRGTRRLKLSIYSARQALERKHIYTIRPSCIR